MEAGRNDTPALAEADGGIAMGTETEVVVQSAESATVKGDPASIIRARNLGRLTMCDIRQNLGSAFAP